jgi:hypothetical protein
LAPVVRQPAPATAGHARLELVTGPVVRSWYPRLGTLAEYLAMKVHHLDAIDEWPPPGTHVIPIAHPEVWGLVVEDSPGSAPTGVEYYTHVGTFQTALPEWVSHYVARVAAIVLDNPLVTLAAVTSDWPVIWNADLGAFMRWIRVTYKGILASGVEEFQFKLDLGKPGDDPSLAEADAPEFAHQRALELVNAAAVAPGGNSLKTAMPTDSKFVEVGACEMTQTEATSSDGSGGNTAQSYPTGYYAYPVGSEVVGTGVGASLPLETSCCVTLQTDTRGPRGRGRFYLPPFTVGALGAGGVYTTQILTTMLAFTKSLSDQIMANTDTRLVVVSGRAIQLHDVTAVKVGKVPDSQRRRRRSQDEARVTQIIVPA